jgi:hypothetical protein
MGKPSQKSYTALAVYSNVPGRCLLRRDDVLREIDIQYILKTKSRFSIGGFHWRPTARVQLREFWRCVERLFFSQTTAACAPSADETSAPSVVDGTMCLMLR